MSIIVPFLIVAALSVLQKIHQKKEQLYVNYCCTLL